MKKVGVAVKMVVGFRVGATPVGLLVAAARPLTKVGCKVPGVGLAVGLVVGYTTGVLVIGPIVGWETVGQYVTPV
jgi:hypothetical protein